MLASQVDGEKRRQTDRKDVTVAVADCRVSCSTSESFSPLSMNGFQLISDIDVEKMSR